MHILHKQYIGVLYLPHVELHSILSFDADSSGTFQTINKYNLDLNAMKGRYEDLERAERLVRVALEQISKRVKLMRPIT